MIAFYIIIHQRVPEVPHAAVRLSKQHINNINV